MRSQIFAKSLPIALVKGALKRIELMRNHPEYRENLWKITNFVVPDSISFFCCGLGSCRTRFRPWRCNLWT